MEPNHTFSAALEAEPHGAVDHKDQTPPKGGLHAKIAGDGWMTAEEAMAYLGYRTRAALYQAVRRGIVPAHRLGSRRLRFRRSELDAELTRGSTRLGQAAAMDL